MTEIKREFVDGRRVLANEEKQNVPVYAGFDTYGTEFGLRQYRFSEEEIIKLKTQAMSLGLREGDVLIAGRIRRVDMSDARLLDYEVTVPTLMVIKPVDIAQNLQNPTRFGETKKYWEMIDSGKIGEALNSVPVQT